MSKVKTKEQAARNNRRAKAAKVSSGTYAPNSKHSAEREQTSEYTTKSGQKKMGYINPKATIQPKIPAFSQKSAESYALFCNNIAEGRSFRKLARDI